ncbi:F-box/WD-40 repeat-containing protein [Hordeum vulgare]|nr:F-box/WD-40 repeat-containing protein [Hordeum vulgare]
MDASEGSSLRKGKEKEIDLEEMMKSMELMEEELDEVHKIPDVYRQKTFVDQLARRIGKVCEVQMHPTLYYEGDYVRVRAKVLTAKPLTRFISLTVVGEVTRMLVVEYEKFPTSARTNGWIAPPSEFAKMNGDAATAEGCGAVGVVCRDSKGVFFGASAISFQHIHDSVILEALAIREAMALGEDVYVQKIQVASDCKTMVDDIKHRATGKHATIIVEIIERSHAFTTCTFILEFRSSNIEAHRLARHALSLGTRLVRTTALVRFLEHILNMYVEQNGSNDAPHDACLARRHNQCPHL